MLKREEKNSLGVHQIMVCHEANSAYINRSEEVVRSSPDDSQEIILDLNMSDLTNNGTKALNNCHVSIDQ